MVGRHGRRRWPEPEEESVENKRGYQLEKVEEDMIIEEGREQEPEGRGRRMRREALGEG